MTRFIARAPTRVDLAGGTLDLWPIHQVLNKGATLNIGISLWAQCQLQLHPQNKKIHLKSEDQSIEWLGCWEELIQSNLSLHALAVKNLWTHHLPGLTLTTQALSPAGAGLGGSSALLVTICKTLLMARQQLEAKSATIEDHHLVKICSDIESRLIHAPTGIQDYWGALRGGLNVIRFPVGGEEITTLQDTKLGQLGEQLVLCYSGSSRQSAINNWEIFKRVFDRDLFILENLEKLGALAEECIQTLMSGDIQGALQISKLEWEQRIKLWPNIHTPITTQIANAAMSAGATLVRVCGAGGGGVMAIFADSKEHKKIKEACSRAGGKILEAHVVSQGYQCEIQ